MAGLPPAFRHTTPLIMSTNTDYTRATFSIEVTEQDDGSWHATERNSRATGRGENPARAVQNYAALIADTMDGDEAAAEASPSPEVPADD